MSNTDARSFAPDFAARGVGLSVFGKPSLTSGQAASNLTAETQWSQQGGALTISFAFRRDGFVPDENSSSFSRFNAQQMQIAQDALNAWAAVANIHFVRADDGDGYSNNATILLGNYLSGPDAGFAFLPGSRDSASEAGDVWINLEEGYNRTPTRENYGYEVLLHEIGHSIGLTHPSDYNGDADGTLTYRVDADYAEDTMRYSVMSYFTANYEKPNSSTIFPLGPQIDDITAVQRLYGANTAYNARDTTYSYNGGAGTIRIGQDGATQALWDGGGIDTIDLSGWTSRTVLDLRAGALTFDGRVMIAEGAVIENAIAPRFGGTIIGNAAANVIRGGDDLNYLYGEGGDDTLVGGAGMDYLDGGSGTNQIDGGAGDDILVLPGFIGDYSSVRLSDGAYRISSNGEVNVVSNVEQVGPAWGTAYYAGIVSFSDFLSNTIERSLFGSYRNGRYTSGHADFDGDGNTDLLVRDGSGNVAVWRATTRVSIYNPYSGASVQFDPALIGTTVVSVSISQRMSSFSLPPGWRIAGSLDVDGDHRADLLLSNAGTRELNIWKAANGGFVDALYQGLAAPSESVLVGTADIDGDGREDMLWKNAAGALTGWFSNGDAFSQRLVAAPSFAGGTTVAALADVNGDGRADLVLSTAGGMQTWLGRGDGFTNAPAFAMNVPASYRLEGTADFNGDGIGDLLWRDGNGAASVWLGGSAGFSQGAFAAGMVDTSWGLATLGDLNRDGMDDVLWRRADGVTMVSLSTENAFRSGTGNMLAGELVPSPSASAALIATGPADDRLVGTDGADILEGFSGNDTLIGGGGSDILRGGSGADTAIYTGMARNYARDMVAGGGTIAGGPEGGVDTLESIETLRFADGYQTNDPNSHVAQVARLYYLVLDRTPDSYGLNSWVQAIEHGASLSTVASGFSGSVEFQLQTSGLSNDDFVEFLYHSALGRASDPVGKSNWLTALDAGALSRGEVIVNFSESIENKQLTADRIQAGFFIYDPTYAAVASLYDTFADRLPDQPGLENWIVAHAAGMTLDAIADGFAASPEFQNKTAGLDERGIVEMLYHNVLNRGGDPDGIAAWTYKLRADHDLGDLILGFSQSAEHQVLMQPSLADGLFVL